MRGLLWKRGRKGKWKKYFNKYSEDAAAEKEVKRLFAVVRRLERDLEAYLVSLCLFDSEDRPVSEATVAGWPERVVKKLFTTAKEISNLVEKEGEAEERAKN